MGKWLIKGLFALAGIAVAGSILAKTVAARQNVAKTRKREPPEEITVRKGSLVTVYKLKHKHNSNVYIKYHLRPPQGIDNLEWMDILRQNIGMPITLPDDSYGWNYGKVIGHVTGVQNDGSVIGVITDDSYLKELAHDFIVSP